MVNPFDPYSFSPDSRCTLGTVDIHWRWLLTRTKRLYSPSTFSSWRVWAMILHDEFTENHDSWFPPYEKSIFFKKHARRISEDVKFNLATGFGFLCQAVQCSHTKRLAVTVGVMTTTVAVSNRSDRLSWSHETWQCWSSGQQVFWLPPDITVGMIDPHVRSETSALYCTVQNHARVDWLPVLFHGRIGLTSPELTTRRATLPGSLSHSLSI